MMKKVLSLILCLTLVLGLAAIPALAAEWAGGPTFSISATDADKDGAIVVTLEMKGKATDVLGAATLNLVYDSYKVEPDTTKGSFKVEDATVGLDLPACITELIVDVNGSNSITTGGKNCTAFSIAAAGKAATTGVGASSKIVYYFKAKEGATGSVDFTLATDAGNFKVSDKSGNNDLIRPEAGSIVAAAETEAPAQTVKFEKDLLTLVVGQTKAYKAKVDPEDGGDLSYSVYEIGEDAVATVDAEGNVTAVKVGTGKIIATAAATEKYAEASASYTVKVIEKPTIKITLTAETLYAGDKFAPFTAKNFTVDYGGIDDYSIANDVLKHMVYKYNGYKIDVDTVIPESAIGSKDYTIALDCEATALNPDYSIFADVECSPFTLTIAQKSSPSPSYGGGSNEAKYDIAIADAAHGKVVSSHSSAPKGARVTITATPDEGYRVEAVVVTGVSGKNIPVEKNSDGTYSFTMPEEKVTVAVTFTNGQDRPFTDVLKTDWFYDAVYYCYDNGLFKGVSDTLFDPNGTMTRAMFATVLYRVAGQPAVTSENPFTDVPAGQWYTDAVIWAAENKLVQGYGNGVFGPTDPITREQAVTVYWRFVGSPAGTGDLTAFKDADQISDWAKDAFVWAVGAGVIHGKLGSVLDPLGNALRSEIATIMRNANALVK